MDVEGRQVMNVPIESGQKLLRNTSELKNGNYLVRIQHINGVKT